MAPLLYSESTPINLLGRDILCPLKATITCTHTEHEVQENQTGTATPPNWKIDNSTNKNQKGTATPPDWKIDNSTDKNQKGTATPPDKRRDSSTGLKEKEDHKD
eukprot:superscaffoldBa00009313_g24014